MNHKYLSTIAGVVLLVGSLFFLFETTGPENKVTSNMVKVTGMAVEKPSSPRDWAGTFTQEQSILNFFEKNKDKFTWDTNNGGYIYTANGKTYKFYFDASLVRYREGTFTNGQWRNADTTYFGLTPSSFDASGNFQPSPTGQQRGVSTLPSWFIATSSYTGNPNDYAKQNDGSFARTTKEDGKDVTYTYRFYDEWGYQVTKSVNGGVITTYFRDKQSRDIAKPTQGEFTIPVGVKPIQGPNGELQFQKGNDKYVWDAAKGMFQKIGADGKPTQEFVSPASLGGTVPPAPGGGTSTAPGITSVKVDGTVYLVPTSLMNKFDTKTGRIQLPDPRNPTGPKRDYEYVNGKWQAADGIGQLEYSTTAKGYFVTTQTQGSTTPSEIIFTPDDPKQPGVTLSTADQIKAFTEALGTDLSRVGLTNNVFSGTTGKKVLVQSTNNRIVVSERRGTGFVFTVHETVGDAERTYQVWGNENKLNSYWAPPPSASFVGFSGSTQIFQDNDKHLYKLEGDALVPYEGQYSTPSPTDPNWAQILPLLGKPRPFYGSGTGAGPGTVPAKENAFFVFVQAADSSVAAYFNQDGTINAAALGNVGEGERKKIVDSIAAMTNAYNQRDSTGNFVYNDYMYDASGSQHGQLRQGLWEDFKKLGAKWDPQKNQWTANGAIISITTSDTASSLIIKNGDTTTEIKDGTQTIAGMQVTGKLTYVEVNGVKTVNGGGTTADGTAVVFNNYDKILAGGTEVGIGGRFTLTYGNGNVEAHEISAADEGRFTERVTLSDSHGASLGGVVKTRESNGIVSSSTVDQSKTEGQTKTQTHREFNGDVTLGPDGTANGVVGVGIKYEKITATTTTQLTDGQVAQVTIHETPKGRVGAAPTNPSSITATLSYFDGKQMRPAATFDFTGTGSQFLNPADGTYQGFFGMVLGGQQGTNDYTAAQRARLLENLGYGGNQPITVTGDSGGKAYLSVGGNPVLIGLDGNTYHINGRDVTGGIDASVLGLPDKGSAISVVDTTTGQRTIFGHQSDAFNVQTQGSNPDSPITSADISYHDVITMGQGDTAPIYALPGWTGRIETQDGVTTTTNYDEAGYPRSMQGDGSTFTYDPATRTFNGVDKDGKTIQDPTSDPGGKKLRDAVIKSNTGAAIMGAYEAAVGWNTIAGWLGLKFDWGIVSALRDAGFGIVLGEPEDSLCRFFSKNGAGDAASAPIIIKDGSARVVADIEATKSKVYMPCTVDDECNGGLCSNGYCMKDNQFMEAWLYKITYYVDASPQSITFNIRIMGDQTVDLFSRDFIVEKKARATSNDFPDKFVKASFHDYTKICLEFKGDVPFGTNEYCNAVVDVSLRQAEEYLAPGIGGSSPYYGGGSEPFTPGDISIDW